MPCTRWITIDVEFEDAVAYAGFCNGGILTTPHRDDVSFCDVTAITVP